MQMGYVSDALKCDGTLANEIDEFCNFRINWRFWSAENGASGGGVRLYILHDLNENPQIHIRYDLFFL